MNIELSILKDDRVLLVSDAPMPDVVKRVEFYREQRLFMLVFINENGEQDDMLMHYEIPENMVYPIEKSPDVILYTMFPDHPPIGYRAPLIKVGNIH